MNTTKYVHSVVLALLIGCIVPGRTLHSSPKNSHVIGAAAIFLGASAGLYALGSWLLSPSDEEILKQEYLFEASLRQYEPLIHHIENQTGKIITDATSVTFLSDELLCSTSQLSCMLDRPVSTLVADLKRDLDRCASYRSDLTKRMHGKTTLYREMQEATNRLYSWSVKLDCIYAHVKANFHFFALCQAGASLRTRYNKEISLAEYYGQDNKGYQLALRPVIKNATHGSSYPYLTYVDRLTNDKNYLDACISRVIHAHGQKAHECKRFSAFLQHLKNVVMSDSEYTQAILESERDRLAQEKRELQQQLLAQQVHNAHLMHQLSTPPVQQVVVHEVVEYEQVPSYVTAHHEYNPVVQETVVHHEYEPIQQEHVVHHHVVRPEEQDHTVYHHVVQPEQDIIHHVAHSHGDDEQ